MQGEFFDVIKNYVDGFVKLRNTTYDEFERIPSNMLPIVAEDKNWKLQVPFGKENSKFYNMMGTSLSDIDTNSKIRDSIWRNILNNITHIYTIQ